MRTPWPSRSAPHHWIASQIDGSPKASPAWMVKWAFSRWRYSKASRCRVGGKPASAPAMSKPDDAAVAPGDGELGDLPRPRLVPHRGEQLPHHDPAAGRRPRPRRSPPARRRRPRRGSARRRRAARGRSGSRRRPRRPRPGPRRTRGRPACRRGRGLHHRDGVVEGLEVAHQRPGVGGLGEPAAQRLRVGRRAARGRISAASSTIVCGRSPPSRWSCSSTLGARRTWSRLGSGAVGSARRSWRHPRTRSPPRSDPMRDLHHARRASPPPPARSSAPATGSTIDQDRVDAVRRRHRRPPVDPRRRRARGRRARSAAPSPTATSRCRCCPCSARRSSASTPPAPSSTTASTRSASPPRSRSAGGSAPTRASPSVTDLPAGKQLTLELDDRDRGRAQARLRRRDASSCCSR